MENLKQAVINTLPDNDREMKNYLQDVCNHGCQSGIVSELIYYVDTVKWYNDHKEAINQMLGELLNDCGFQGPEELFDKKWNSDDPLALDQHNQNLLAWYSYEEIASRLLDELENEEVA